MNFTIDPLPYQFSELEPYISKETLDYHYNKHHMTYLNNLNKLISDSSLAGRFNGASLESLINKINSDEIYRNPQNSFDANLYNNAAQTWNHELYWKSMSPNGGDKSLSNQELQYAIEKSFGSLDKFKSDFKNAGLTQFGSGWVWLIKNGSALSIEKTSNALIPDVELNNILAVMDVWEHSYYLDEQNKRPSYIDNFLNNLINWENIAKKFNS